MFIETEILPSKLANSIHNDRSYFYDKIKYFGICLK